MNKIKALNEKSSSSSASDEDSEENVVLTREAQEENLHSLYHEALEELKKGDDSVAEERLKTLLELLKSFPSTETISSSQRLKYLTLKNLGSICKEDMEYYLQALEIDGTDLNLWIKAGQRAFDVIQDYVLARNCLVEAYELSPTNWIVIDKLLDTYMILHDLRSALDVSVLSLELQSSYPKAQVVMFEVCRIHPSLKPTVPERFQCLWTLSPYLTQYYEIYMSGIRCLKEKRRRRFEEDLEKHRPKRPKLHLSLEVSECSLRVLGSRLLKLKEQMDKDGVPGSMGIEISFDRTVSSQEETPSGSTDESNASQETGKDVGEKKKRSRSCHKDNNNSSTGFPVEFLDKRRSSRVQRLNKPDGTDSSVREQLLSMVPPAIRSRVIEVEEEDEEQVEAADTVSSEQVEREIVESFLSKLSAFLSKPSASLSKPSDPSQQILISDLVRIFCHEVAMKAHLINLGQLFTKLYDHHRAFYRLPSAFRTVINDTWSVEEMVTILVANELKYRPSEVFFLEMMLICLETVLDEEKFDEFLVRLMYLQATEGGESDRFDQILDILSSKHMKVEASNKVVISVSSIKSLQGAKCELSLTQLLEMGKYVELTNILTRKRESEISSNEEDLLFESIVRSGSWEIGIESITKREKLDERKVKLLLKCLDGGRRGRMNVKLMEKLINYASEESSICAWCCLYWSFFAECDPQVKSSDKQMIQLLTIGHQYLGKKGVCTSSDGQFLLLSLDYILNHSNDTHGSLDDEALQCFNCLFGFPARKSSHSSCSKIKLAWSHSPLLFSFYTSQELPEFDDNKNVSIDTETEQLLSQLLELVPEKMRPDSKSKVITHFLGSEDDKFPEFEKPDVDTVTRNLYYLLADFNFKNKEFKKAKYFYALDLVLNPDRFDSWAGYGLTRSHQLEQLMSKGDNFTKHETVKLFKMADACYKCYQMALQVDPTCTKLWIECGNILYNVSSHIARMIRTAQYMKARRRNVQDSEVVLLRTKHRQCLDLSLRCFTSASESEPGEEDDESWLPFYLLGKIHEKSNLMKALTHYELADLHLFNNGAHYPKKISYYNPPWLATEALEVYFRIHVCVLKYLTSSKVPNRRNLTKIKWCLLKAAKSPFVKQTSSSSTTENDVVSTASSSDTCFIKDVEPVRELLTDIVDIVSDRLDRHLDVNELKKKLIEMCLNAIYRCLVRYPTHYKSLYRLAYYFYVSGDVMAASQVLLNNFRALPDGFSPSTFQQQNQMSPVVISGLFFERKQNNLFNGIWRIPIDEVDRPGSFSSHMYRSAFLLIRVSTVLFDFNTLSQVTIQLSKIPEAGKKYLRDGDRLMLAKEAFDSCSAILKKHSEVSGTSFLPTVNGVCERMIKEKVFVNEAQSLMRECFNQVHARQ